LAGRSRGGRFVIDILIRIVINAVALVVAAKIVPDIHLTIGTTPTEWLKVGIVAAVFGLVNAYIKPIVKALSFPLTLATLGLVSFVINAAMLLLAAWISTEVLKLHFTIAKFPPTFNGDALIAAILGSIVISIVSTLLGFLNFGRRAVF
jgi:putative membrane protein